MPARQHAARGPARTNIDAVFENEDLRPVFGRLEHQRVLFDRMFSHHHAHVDLIALLLRALGVTLLLVAVFAGLLLPLRVDL